MVNIETESVASIGADAVLFSKFFLINIEFKNKVGFVMGIHF